MEQINKHSPLPDNKAAIDFLREKGILKPGYTQWIIQYADRQGFNATDLFTEFFNIEFAKRPDQETISALTERVKELEELAQFVACSGADMPTIQIAARALLTPKNNGE